MILKIVFSHGRPISCYSLSHIWMSAMRLLLVAYLALKTAHAQIKRESLILPVPTLYQCWQALAATLSAFSAATHINIFTSSTVYTKLNVLLLLLCCCCCFFLLFQQCKTIRGAFTLQVPTGTVICFSYKQVTQTVLIWFGFFTKQATICSRDSSSHPSYVLFC